MDEMTAQGTQANPPRRLHLKHVEGMRAVAALVVFVNHAYAQVWNPGQGQFPSGAWAAFSNFLVAGHLSVTVFIVISGFCLALPVANAGGELRGGSRAFFKRRARRILPPYYGAVALCLLLIATVIGKPTGTLWDVPILVTRTSIISHALLLQDFFATSSINYVFWSIAVEWQIYFLFPLLVWAFRRFGPARSVSAAFVVGYGIRLAFAHTRIVRANPHYIGMFALGMLAAYVSQFRSEDYQRARQNPIWAWMFGLGFLAAFAAAATWGIKTSADRFYLLDLPVGLMAGGALVVSSRSEDNLLFRLLSWKPFVAIGSFSYSVYLIHAPMLQVIWQFMLRPAGLASTAMFAFMMTIGLGLVLACSYLFFRVFEAPFMQPRARQPAPAMTAT
jgi:peptidoglycan/LPS O-acetylase OafA/YrhL